MFESFLRQDDTAAWLRALDALAPSIHDVDRNATRIWFHFFPLKLAQAFEQTTDTAKLARELRLDGRYRLAGQADSSHWFLYGHRYWPQVKAAIVKRAESTAAASSLDLATVIRDIAREASTAAGADGSLIVGISAVGLMTLQQAGLEAFKADSNAAGPLPAQTRKTPERIVADRKKDDGQGLAGLYRGIRKQFSVVFDERREDGRFTVVNTQQLTTASANDTRDYSAAGPRRCHEGPIPVECRTASCGTCWVGILGGAEKLSDVEEMEARRLKEFGYLSSGERKPLIRLACMAAASGNVTIAIPPWNGFIGKSGFGN